MSPTLPPYEPPPIEDAKRQYVELFGSALVMNTYLKVALLAVSSVAVGLVGRRGRDFGIADRFGFGLCLGCVSIRNEGSVHYQERQRPMLKGGTTHVLTLLRL